MKKILLLILVIIYTSLIVSIYGQNNEEHTANKISKAISKGNYSELSRYFSKSIDLAIPGNERTYSYSQAEMILRDFFSNYMPKSFSIISKGKANPNNDYVIGEEMTDKGMFRIFWLMNKMSGKYLIQQLKFEKE